jgi:hypothetical protein
MFGVHNDLSSFRQVVTCLLREKMILRGYESHYRDGGNAALLC